jgi:glycosyltransferase involved in cell wall biosynthesis
LSEQPDATILIPALNEENTIAAVLDRVLALDMSKQVIVIDNGSTDKTSAILSQYADKIDLITNQNKTGKGASIRQAIPLAKGKVVVIQDADLEYFPEELPALIQPILDGKADVVYGTRFSQGMPKSMALPNKIVNKLLVLAVRILYGKKITDEATCYKAIKRESLEAMHLVCERFEFCPEVTAKSYRLQLRLIELPIRYEARSKEAGKKIRWTDAPEAFWTLLKHRFWRP